MYSRRVVRARRVNDRGGLKLASREQARSTCWFKRLSRTRPVGEPPPSFTAIAQAEERVRRRIFANLAGEELSDCWPHLESMAAAAPGNLHVRHCRVAVDDEVAVGSVFVLAHFGPENRRGPQRRKTTAHERAKRAPDIGDGVRSPLVGSNAGPRVSSATLNPRWRFRECRKSDSRPRRPIPAGAIR